MAKILQLPKSNFGISAKKFTETSTALAQSTSPSELLSYNMGITTVSNLLGGLGGKVRSREEIYLKIEQMGENAICSSALALLATATLGGHETTGDVVFIEKKDEILKDKQLCKTIDEIAADLSPLINRESYGMIYLAEQYGDAYTRIYAEPKKGIIDLYTGELIRPPLIYPFEQSNQTVFYDCCDASTGYFKRLDISQMARLKLTRTQWYPQTSVLQKAMKFDITENDIDKLNPMPSTAGGSLLLNAEQSYNNLIASMAGLVGQRFLDSIDEQVATLNMDGMNLDQQNKFVKNFTDMILMSKNVADTAVKNGQPFLTRLKHLLPLYNEKQQVNFMPLQSARSGTIGIDDILLLARLVATSIGVDLSAVGFADMVAGSSFGDGGLFRTSAQMAERARINRIGHTDWAHHLIDIHMALKYGSVFNPKNRPYQLNYYSAISALESERARTAADKANSTMMRTQVIQMNKEMGATEEMMFSVLSNDFGMPEERAKLLAGIVSAQPANAQEEM